MAASDDAGSGAHPAPGGREAQRALVAGFDRVGDWMVEGRPVTIEAFLREGGTPEEVGALFAAM